MRLDHSTTATLTALARQLNARHRGARTLPALLLLSDDVRLPDPLSAAWALSRHSAIVLRHYQAVDKARLARRLARACHSRGLVLLIAGDPALAARVHADGLHLGEARLAQVRRWRQQRPDWLITVSAHTLPALINAQRAGADAALLAPVFATASHPGARPIGPVRFAALVHKSPLPVIALGGIDAITARRLKESGAAGLAAIGALKATGGRPASVSPD
jgi:thiamine-phosphate pyrophosphorylase